MNKSYAAQLSPETQKWIEETFCPEDQQLAEIRQKTEAAGLPAIQVGTFDARHLEVFVKMLGAKKSIEIGSLGGYSALCICRGMGPAGKLYCLELEADYAQVAQNNLEHAGVGEQVEFLIGPASDSLQKISSQGPFDLVFIDADKVNYPKYLEWSMNHLRVGGAVIGDNTFGFGYLGQTQFEDDEQREVGEAIGQFNRVLAQDPRFKTTILPTSEGMTLGIKIHD